MHCNAKSANGLDDHCSDNQEAADQSGFDKHFDESTVDAPVFTASGIAGAPEPVTEYWAFPERFNALLPHFDTSREPATNAAAFIMDMKDLFEDDVSKFGDNQYD